MGDEGLEEVAAASEAEGLDIDVTNSTTLQESLSRLEAECNDPMILQTITALLTTPMKNAEYIAAGCVPEEEWRHFALNIPYYTHFTSPIRRYADVQVHRILLATIEGKVSKYYLSENDIHAAAKHCNERNMSSKKAQERADRVFLAIYLKKRPMMSEIATVTSMGKESFTVLVLSTGVTQRVNIPRDHPLVKFQYFAGERRIHLVPLAGHACDWTR